MSTQAAVGSYTTYDNKPALVVRVVDSSTFFETEEGECYILAEKYAELRVEGETEPKFLTFNSQNFPMQKQQPATLKGLDPKIWKRCP